MFGGLFTLNLLYVVLNSTCHWHQCFERWCHYYRYGREFQHNLDSSLKIVLSKYWIDIFYNLETMHFSASFIEILLIFGSFLFITFEGLFMVILVTTFFEFLNSDSSIRNIWTRSIKSTLFKFQIYFCIYKNIFLAEKSMFFYNFVAVFFWNYYKVQRFCEYWC